MTTLKYNWKDSVIIMNAMILKIMHDIFNVLNTEVVICGRAYSNQLLFEHECRKCAAKFAIQGHK